MVYDFELEKYSCVYNNGSRHAMYQASYQLDAWRIVVAQKGVPNTCG